MQELPSAETSVKKLKGVGPAKADSLEKIGIFTYMDLVRHFPRAYQERGDIRSIAMGADGAKHAFVVTIATKPQNARLPSRMTLTKFRVFDDSASCEVVFFNQPYLKDVFHVGDSFRLFGYLSYSKNRYQMTSPAYEPYSETTALPDFFPVYSLPDGISQKQMQQLVSIALPAVLPKIIDPIPDSIRLKNSLPTLSLTYQTLHMPESNEKLENALRRIVFDELLCLGIGVSLSKTSISAISAIPCQKVSFSDFLACIPYELTNAQKRAINDIYTDMTGLKKEGVTYPPMRRILIGDVGCGKTICAAAAIYIALSSGHQAALMVPTTILAEQHYKELAPLFEKLGYSVALLSGNTKQSERRKIISDLGPGGQLSLVIGTHALLSDDVSFRDLSLTVTDEQHRFGVMQRASLKEKNQTSHMLVMSATPIPRTLAHVLYGDLSVSKIDEMPKGRQKVDTFVVDETYRSRLNSFIRKQVELGGQVYIVCPSIEVKEDQDEEDGTPIEDLSFSSFKTVSKPPLKDAVGFSRFLSTEVFPDIPLTLLHGKMKPSEKEEAMSKFVSGQTKILVSTTVIEVGVNVPNATLMIVENAERFGLSQLHQLRGRVGRGSKKSYCILVSDSHSETAKARLEVMHTTYDGYKIAEEDLALRGPGDFFTTASGESRQSGGLPLKLASCCHDSTLMEAAFEAAHEIVSKDPDLTQPDHSLLRKEVDRIFTVNQNTVS